jgi:DNA-binding transcriptional regulator YhcF (GntR family)
MIKFNLDKKVNLSFYEQVKGQLLSAIYCGKIKEGDRLPSIRELADDLGVNYKTVRRIYLNLAEEGYLEMMRGSGAFLKKRSGEDNYEQMRRRAVFKLLNEVTEKARNLGLTTQQFARLFDGLTTGANLRKLNLAVVDHEEEAFIFSRELRSRLGAEVVPISLDAGTEEISKAKEVDYLLTTSWHMDEVRTLAESIGKPVLEIKPSHQIYTEVLAAARDQNIAVVIQDERTMHASHEIFMNLYHPSTQKRFWIASIDREDLIDDIVEKADLIFVSPMCWDEMRKRTPAEKELKTYEHFISETTITDLKELQLLG